MRPNSLHVSKHHGLARRYLPMQFFRLELDLPQTVTLLVVLSASLEVDDHQHIPCVGALVALGP